MERTREASKILISYAIRHLREVMEPLDPEEKKDVFRAVVKGYCPLCGNTDDYCTCGRSTQIN